MTKYIDAVLLRKKITEQIESLPREVGRGAGTITSKGYGMMQAFQIMRSIINSLQQEHVPENEKTGTCEDASEYIRTIKSLIADFIRDKQPGDVDYYQKIYDWLDKQ